MKSTGTVRFHLRQRESIGCATAKLLFFFWGIIGLLLAPFGMTSGLAVIAAVPGILAWIGGMLFFGFLALMCQNRFDMIEIDQPQ